MRVHFSTKCTKTRVGRNSARTLYGSLQRSLDALYWIGEGREGDNLTRNSHSRSFKVTHFRNTEELTTDWGYKKE